MEPRQGWTSQPNSRGTLDIIWDCSFTMFLCSWSILCLNVPPRYEHEVYRWRRKFWFACLTLSVPEWTFQMALGQWLRARSSVRQFHAAKHTDWTMKHAFYANMGGFILQAKDWTGDHDGNRKTNWAPFPVDADQLLYLVNQGYIELPSIDERTIKEKDKVDGAIRLLTICQIFWFVINVSGRAAASLPITCLELTTAAFLICVVGISLCWYHKPADLTIPEIIETNVYIQEIILGAGEESRKIYSRTPLDFVNSTEWSLSLYWHHCWNTLRHWHVPVGGYPRPLPALENTYTLPLPDWALSLAFALSAIYLSIFFCAWNFTFPTPIESTLWRAAILTTVGTMVALAISTKFCFEWYPALQRRFPDILLNPRAGINDRRMHQSWPGYPWLARAARRTRAALKNNSISQDPAFDVPLKGVLPLYFLLFFYFPARTYIFIADLIELRSLPAKAYVTVEWSNVVPHL